MRATVEPLVSTRCASSEGTKAITSFVWPVAGDDGTAVVRATVRAAHKSTTLDRGFTLFPPRLTTTTSSWSTGLPGLLSLPAHFTCHMAGVHANRLRGMRSTRKTSRPVRLGRRRLPVAKYVYSAGQTGRVQA